MNHGHGKVLVVDDELFTRFATVALLKAHGFDAAVVEDGRRALDYLLVAERPALIVLDLLMPEMDGQEFFAQLRCRPAFADIPVVIYTASADALEQSRPLSAVDHILKTDPPEALLEAALHLAATLVCACGAWAYARPLPADDNPWRLLSDLDAAFRQHLAEGHRQPDDSMKSGGTSGLPP